MFAYSSINNFEIGFVGAALTGLLLDYLDIAGSSVILAISLTSLAVVYFLGGFQIPDPEKANAKNMGYQVLYISWAVALMGILFKFLHLPGASALTKIGLASMGISLIMVIATSTKDWGRQENLAVVRSVLIAIPILMLYFDEIPI